MALSTRFSAVSAALAAALAPQLRAQCPGWSTSFGPPAAGDGVNARIYDMVTFEQFPGAGRALIAGGNFSAAGTAVTTDQVALWDGSNWFDVGSNCGTSGQVFALTTYEVGPGGFGGIATGGNELYAGGDFTAIDCVAVNHVALWAGGVWNPLFDAGTGIDGTNGNVYAMTPFDIDAGGPIPPMLVVVGQFSAVGGTIAANNVAFWFGGSWSPMGSCAGGGTSGGLNPGRVDALCVFNDGSGPELYAGGYFTSVDSGTCATPASLVAKWNPWSNTWAAVGTLAGTNVYDLAVFDDGSGGGAELYAGGNFAIAGGAHVAKWNGVSWVTVGVGFNNVVRDLCVYDCGGKERLVASGHFTASGTTGTNLVAYWSGASWQPIASGLGVQTPPIALCAAQFGSGYDLFVGGIFTQANGQPSSYIAAGCICPAAPFPTPQGVAAVTTYAGAPGEFPLSLVDIRGPLPTPDTNWGAPMFHNEFAPSAATEIWNEDNLGQVFGVTFDAASPPNIYVAATTVYWGDTLGPGGSGAVYKIDGTTGDTSTFCVLPNTGPELGDICYDAFHDQFFVSNFEDGKIYRITSAGVIAQVFDPFAADNGAAGYAPLGERVWAVQSFNGRELYFSVWLVDNGRTSATWPTAWPAWNASAGPNVANNAIFKCGLNGGTGVFLNGPAVLVEVLPTLPSASYSNPCSDIRFSPDNTRMLLAERGMSTDSNPDPHAAEVLEYVGGGPGIFSAGWALSATPHWIGTFSSNRNAAGGADYTCEYRVLATGDALQFSPDVIYGLQLIPAAGNAQGAGATSTSYLHDMNALTTQADKTEIGDCDIFRKACTSKVFPYCTAKVNSLGCYPRIGATGNPSASASSGFVVTCTDVIGMKSGLLFYGLNGESSNPFQGGTMCVRTPVQRTQAQSSGGTSFACDGTFAIDMNAYAQSGFGNPALAVPGTTVNCQWWSRDPASPSTTSLSDALEYSTEP